MIPMHSLSSVHSLGTLDDTPKSTEEVPEAEAMLTFVKAKYGVTDSEVEDYE